MHESESSATESAYQDSVCAAIYTAYETPVSKPELRDKDTQDARDSSEYENGVMCKAACRKGNDKLLHKIDRVAILLAIYI